ncbi:hypothetical protein SHKM778_65180 [Streptomyces sp. KM77-8]|uniref:PAC2 family protein n=1 Tax=Streptomyces haneummycinicus TaxID=3074435 RepID=A0AAT9HSV5_9ACTN
MIELEGVPELIDPVMVAAFEGWNDAGDAASTAVAHLEREWKGEVFAALDAEDYYDFQVNRPTVFMDGGVRKVTWPTTRLSVVRVGGDEPRDLVLVRGIEPSMRWRSFCNEILGFAHELGVELVVVLGALLGDTPTPGRSRSAGPRPTRTWPAGWIWRRPGTRVPRASSASSRRRARTRVCRPCRCGRRCRTTSRSRPTRRRRWPS